MKGWVTSAEQAAMPQCLCQNAAAQAVPGDRLTRGNTAGDGNELHLSQNLLQVRQATAEK